jgi:two-component system chemotaxis response regulator CheY
MKKKIILIVDDSKTVRDQVRTILEGAGYAVAEAADGQQALEKIRMVPDLAMVLCDVQMPNLSGIAMVERLKADGMIANLPVIMLTTEAQLTLITRAKQAGAKAWIVKPFKPEHVVAAVDKLAR